IWPSCGCGCRCPAVAQHPPEIDATVQPPLIGGSRCLHFSCVFPPCLYIGKRSAMIQIHINVARVERVLFLPSSDLEEDYDLAAWQIIRPLVDKIDRALRKSRALFG